MAEEESLNFQSGNVSYEAEKAALGGPTLFVNRYTIQTYPDGGVRMTLLEQYSGNPAVPPVYRTAVFLTQASAIELAQALMNVLPVGSVALPTIASAVGTSS